MYKSALENEESKLFTVAENEKNTLKNYLLHETIKFLDIYLVCKVRAPVRMCVIHNNSGCLVRLFKNCHYNKF